MADRGHRRVAGQFETDIAAQAAADMVGHRSSPQMLSGNR
jgi:hypothetical protein